MTDTRPPELLYNEDMRLLMIRVDLAETPKQAFRGMYDEAPEIIGDLEMEFITGRTVDGTQIEVCRPVFSEYKALINEIKLSFHRLADPSNEDEVSTEFGADVWIKCEASTTGAVAYWERGE